ncbi:DUF2147 domain-containing protein [Aquimarina sp. 2201CG14-23]|uniref:DUF2147 domain-containing protein n=1 Tax=Aquimarina mycalae TaxID=3040073 RepID=UPI002477F0E2|nr:DUF2147 domain-containing protein [Aquimarina sp. 2201CG14-23]MDH7445546.1 DUF2147 domain-containing protein [Aquimarina sp. 2201CG14-23]
MRLIFIAFISVLFLSSIKPETYVGKWRIEGGSIIEIYTEGDIFFGKIDKRAEQPISNLNGLDNKNPDHKLRNRSLLGMDILENLSFNDGELSGGTIYNADSGKTYTVKVWIDPDNVNVCFIRAYKGILFKTFEATRIK